jgi:hypothetical protein
LFLFCVSIIVTYLSIILVLDFLFFLFFVLLFGFVYGDLYHEINCCVEEVKCTFSYGFLLREPEIIILIGLVFPIFKLS